LYASERSSNCPSFISVIELIVNYNLVFTRSLDVGYYYRCHE